LAKVLPLPAPLPPPGLGTAAALRALADALPQGVLTTDAEGLITFWSDEAARITGYGREETLGKPRSLFLGDALPPLAGGPGTGGRSSRFFTIRARDGRELRILKNVVELVGDGGVALGALVTFVEVADHVASVPRPIEVEPQAGTAADVSGLVGRHAEMRNLRRTIERVSRSETTVMILGESGTGKDLVARAIHRMSPRASGLFVRVSCASLEGDPTALFGSGYGERRGRVDEATGGTLFLDEVGDLPAHDQARLLRFLEQRAAAEAGETRASPPDVRLLCASHRDLRQLVAEGAFRADLYYRLAVFALQVPPLRSHLDDVPEIAAALLARRGATPTLSAGAVAALRSYEWPGNIRELDNVLERALVLSGGDELNADHLPPQVASAAGHAALAESASRSERAATLEALAASGWNRTKAAAVLGISRVTLWKRIRKHGLIPGADEHEPDDA
jgi:PAS domain S-box-containing protein